MPEDRSRIGDPVAAAEAALDLALGHGDDLIGGTRGDLLVRGATLLRQVTEGGGVLAMRAAWRFGAAHHYRGEYPTARRWFEAALADSDPDPVDRARFLGGYASVLWAQGDAEAGQRVADEAMSVAE